MSIGQIPRRTLWATRAEKALGDLPCYRLTLLSDPVGKIDSDPHPFGLSMRKLQ